MSIDQGAGKSANQVLEDMGPTLSTTHYGAPAVCYGISPYASNAMLSDNPQSGIYEADTSRTLDLNGGSPACNQGGVAVVQKALNGWDVQSKHIQPQDGIAEALYSGECRYGGGESYVMADAIPIEGNGQRESHKGDGYGKQGDPSFTLNRVEVHAVMAVDAWNGTEAEECNGNLQSSAAHNIHSNNVVRVKK